MKPASPEAIQEIAEVAQRKGFDRDRAAELAEEVHTLMAAVETASTAINFDDEPLHYQAFIAASKPVT